MKRRYGWIAVIVVVALSLPGCAIVQKLKARDRLNKGVAAYKDKRYPDAIDHFQRAMEMDPDLITAHIYLATTYRTQYIPGGYSKENVAMAEKAIDIFKGVLDKDPRNLNAIANIAGLYNDMENYDEARSWRLKQLELEPNKPEPLYANAVIDWKLAYSKTGVTGELVADMTPEEKADVAKMVDSGIESLKRALEIDPEYENAMQYYNLLLREKAKLTKDDEEKKQYLKEADRLALRYIEITRKKAAEEEERRKVLGGAQK